MLYVSNNGETCKDQLCQHPECWQTNVRRVREAVRQRNGIYRKEEPFTYDQPRRMQSAPKEETFLRDINESLSLPTLKVIDLASNLTTPYSNGDQLPADKHNSPYCFTTAPTPVRMKPDHPFGIHAPHTTPVSPSIPEVKKKWKEKIHCARGVDEKANNISFHEIYDYEEVYQDWQETFISSPYLVWCPSKKKREKRRSRASSATTDFRTGGFKNIFEHVLPQPAEDIRTRTPRSKVPTGGQPYSPCRSPATRQDTFRPGDYTFDGDFVMTVTKEDVPKSLITSKKIIENKMTTGSKDHAHLEVRKEKDIAQTKESTKQDEPRILRSGEPGQKQLAYSEPRKALPLPSVGIPWGLVPKERPNHCKNSIPHGVDLGVIMEPVIYQPRSASADDRKQRVMSDVALSQDNILKDDNVTGLTEERDHITSAYRFSPRLLPAPAPTPITPCTRDDLRRQLSDLIRSNTTRALSKTILAEENQLPSAQQQEKGTVERTSFTRASCGQGSRILNDHVILEVEETNRNTFPEVGAEFSIMATDDKDKEQVVCQNGESRWEGLEAGVDQGNDNGSTASIRAVSPSSRTNIPPDIWAELRGEVLDCRMAPRSVRTLDFCNPETLVSKGITRGFHSSLGLSIYSYTESSWKPAATKLPRSFRSSRTVLGPYKQTILPRMPASLTVVPVPSVTRLANSCTQPRQRHVDKEDSCIRMPPVPVGSPAADIEVCIPDGAPTRLTPNGSEVRCVMTSEGTGPEHKSGDDELRDEVEYLIQRDVMIHEDMQKSKDMLGEAHGEVVTQEIGTEDIGAEEILAEVDLSELKQSIEHIDMVNKQDLMLLESSSAMADDTKCSEAFPMVTDYNRASVTGSPTPKEKLVLDADYSGKNEAFSGSKKKGDSEDSLERDVRDEKPTGNSRNTSSNVILDDNRVSVGYHADKLQDFNKIDPNAESSQDTIAPGSFEQVQPETSKESLVSSELSDFQLEPFNVESELLRPIHIESDLFLLNSDSNLGLSFDEDLDALG